MEACHPSFGTGAIWLATFRVSEGKWDLQSSLLLDVRHVDLQLVHSHVGYMGKS